MATKLFVGGLPYAVTSDQLEELFAAIGKVVSAQVVSDKYSGQSKGFGFVEMESDDDARKAVQELDGKEFEGRRIAVSEARPRENRERSFGGGGDRGGDRGGFRGGNSRRDDRGGNRY